MRLAEAPYPGDGFGGGVGVVGALMLRMWPCGLGLMGPSVGELAPLPCVGLWRSMVLGERRSRSEKPALDRLESNWMGGGGGVFVRAWLPPCVGDGVGRGEGVLRAGVEIGPAEPARARGVVVPSVARGVAMIVWSPCDWRQTK